jgi:hypothetical protein
MLSEPRLSLKYFRDSDGMERGLSSPRLVQRSCTGGMINEGGRNAPSPNFRDFNAIALLYELLQIRA